MATFFRSLTLFVARLYWVLRKLKTASTMGAYDVFS